MPLTEPTTILEKSGGGERVRISFEKRSVR